MVTGGEDKRVNMWAIGKQNSIMVGVIFVEEVCCGADWESLAGHTAAVSCVCFDALEELVIAGAHSGVLKVWDLDQQKVVRTLTGHTGRSSQVDFHPFGEFFASGADDSLLKIWDLRRKGCIQTYAGHRGSISAIRFSPDGRWVISGGEDGSAKVWDLTAGKLLRSLEHPRGVEALDFHPSEFLLVSGDSHRLRLWDLETFSTIEELALPAPHPVLAFAPLPGPSGNSDNPPGTLLAALPDSLRLFAWEPLRDLDEVRVPWDRVGDMTVTANQLIVGSYRDSLVSVWVVPLDHLRPLAKDSFTPEPSLDLNRTAEALKTLEGPDFPEDPDPPQSGFEAIPSPARRTEPVGGTKQPLGLKPEDFLPVPSQSQSPQSGESLWEELHKSHLSVCGVLALRLTNVKVVRSAWAKGDVQETIDTLSRVNDPAVVVDVLKVLGEQPQQFTLDWCVALLPLLQALLPTPHPEYQLPALRTLKHLGLTFGPVILQALAGPPLLTGVDLSREERAAKCLFCRRTFLALRPPVEALAKGASPVAQTAREFLAILKGFADPENV